MTVARTAGRANVFRAVLGFVLGHWRRRPATLGGIAAAVIAATMADVLIPLFAGRLVDAVARGAADPAARAAAIAALTAMGALGAAIVALRHLAVLGIVRLTLGVMTALAQDAFRRVQRFSTDWHASSFAGSTVRKITRGMWAVDLLDDVLLMALLPSLVVLLGTTLLLAWHWLVMGLVVALGAAAYILLTVILSFACVAPAARLSNQWDTRLGGALADAVTCNAVVKAFGAEGREDARLAALLAKWHRRIRRTWRRENASGTAQTFALLLLRVAVIAAALWLWVGERASPGDVAYVLAAYFVVHGYLRDVGMHVRMVQRAVNELEELVAILATPIGVADAVGAVPIRIGGGRIAFEDVTFHYPGHVHPLYRGFSLVIEPGEKVGLVGHSGSGKTTFVKLVQRLHDVTAGRVTIDGQDVARVTQGSLRAQVAIVPQEPILFHRSLAENIAYARPGASPADIAQAARRANAERFIVRLPKGYATLVGERGVKLSGGERQRIALARAFLADAPILILDEATSSLDSESEALIQEAMERLMRGRTTIVVAHRLSTVRALDRILVFDRGRIVEEGGHDALLRRRNGVYRLLFERQAMGLAGSPGDDAGPRRAAS
jgi:ATP-binding cassette subfamily B protein